MSHPFQSGGALLADSPVYVEREADTEALAHLRNMAYLLFIEPRQQGKTSFINRLMTHSALSSDTLALIDLTTLDALSETGWYRSLCTRLLRQLRFIPRTDRPAPAENSTGWRDFLINVSEQADAAHRRTIVALDEIGAVVIPWAEPFFCILREVFNARQAEPYFRHLTFILSGAFHPRDLIEDDRISPFNVAQRVRLADFTLAQVRELVGKGNWTDEQAAVLAERIHYWTDGQPYLTQLLCSYLEPDATPADVGVGVERLRREDENHLPPMLKRLNSDEKLRKYVDRILTGEHIKFYPQENRRQAQLELLGVIKEDAEGFCTIRNRIYERVLAGIAGLTVGPSTSAAMLHPELNDALTRRTLALFIGADLPHEVTGLPSRADLARELARRKGLDESLSLAEVAQRVSQAGNRWEFTAFIRDALDTTGKSPLLLQRVSGNPAGLSAEEALWLATVGGAQVLGRDDIGQLALGKAADFIGFRLERLDYAGALHDPLAALVFCTPQRVDLSVINGRVVVEDGHLLTVDLGPVVERHNRIARELVGAT